MSWYGEGVKKEYSLGKKEEKKQNTFLDEMVSDQRDAEEGYIGKKRGRKPGSKNKTSLSNASEPHVSSDDVQKVIQESKDIVSTLKKENKTQNDTELHCTRKLTSLDEMFKSADKQVEEQLMSNFNQLQDITRSFLKLAQNRYNHQDQVKIFEIVADVQKATNTLVELIIKAKGF